MFVLLLPKASTKRMFTLISAWRNVKFTMLVLPYKLLVATILRALFPRFGFFRFVK